MTMHGEFVEPSLFDVVQSNHDTLTASADESAIRPQTTVFDNRSKIVHMRDTENGSHDPSSSRVSPVAMGSCLLLTV